MDQLNSITNRFKEDIHTKRAVASIYDPSVDFCDSKDIPCNNWLHFINRNGLLHLNVSVRANDAIWGFSGINFFEWSVVLEVMAHTLDLQVGSINWFAGSMHIYDRHYTRAEKMLAATGYPSLYESGIPSIPIASSLGEFDSQAQQVISRSLATRNRQPDELTPDISDAFLRACDLLLSIYNLHKRSGEDDIIYSLLAEIPPSDLRVASVEYLCRSRGTEWAKRIPLSWPEEDFLSRFWEYEASQECRAEERQRAHSS